MHSYVRLAWLYCVTLLLDPNCHNVLQMFEGPQNGGIAAPGTESLDGIGTNGGVIVFTLLFSHAAYCSRYIFSYNSPTRA